MSPRAQQFTKERILDEAIGIVRAGGMGALSARALAESLGSSVAPVYGAFPSMEELREAILLETTRRLDASIKGLSTGRPFLDMGLGMVRFARDEKELYEALLESGGAKGAMGGYMKELRRRLATTPVLGDLDPAVLDSVFERMWLFTLGLAMAMRHGFVKDLDDEKLFLLMSSQGALVTVGEAEAEGKLGSGEALFTAFLSRRKNVAGKRHAKPAKK